MSESTDKGLGVVAKVAKYIFLYPQIPDHSRQHERRRLVFGASIPSHHHWIKGIQERWDLQSVGWHLYGQQCFSGRLKVIHRRDCKKVREWLLTDGFNCSASDLNPAITQKSRKENVRNLWHVFFYIKKDSFFPDQQLVRGCRWTDQGVCKGRIREIQKTDNKVNSEQSLSSFGMFCIYSSDSQEIERYHCA